MGKKQDKQALAAYQAAAMLGAYGQGFATPDSGAYRTAAAMTDSAQGSIAAQANYMAAKKAKKKRGTGDIVKDTVIGGAKGFALGGPVGAAIGAGAGAAGMGDAIAPAGQAYQAAQTAPKVADTTTVAAKSVQPDPARPVFTDGAGVTQSPYVTAPANYDAALAAKSAPAPAPGPVAAPPPQQEGALSLATGGQFNPGVAALGTALALGGGALAYNQVGGKQTPGMPPGKQMLAGMNPLGGGTEMTPAQLSGMDALGQKAWAVQMQKSGFQPTFHQWQAMDRGVRKDLQKLGLKRPASPTQELVQKLMFGGAVQQPQQQDRYTYFPK